MTNLDAEALQLYRRSRELFLVGRVEEAEIIYRALRRDHSVELYPGVELPVHMKLIHPIGCVLGRAIYGDYLVAYQCSGIGSDIDGNRPTIGNGVVLFPGARVLGASKIGDNVFIEAGTILSGVPRRPVKIPSNVCVFPAANGFGYDWKTTKRNVIEHFWK